MNGKQGGFSGDLRHGSRGGGCCLAAVLSGPAWAGRTSQAGAIQANGTRARNTVFVQTNDPSANSIVAFQRDADGTLALAASYRTGFKSDGTTGHELALCSRPGAALLNVGPTFSPSRETPGFPVHLRVRVRQRGLESHYANTTGPVTRRLLVGADWF